jgi:Kef-type K+ transport system membrane component KefB
MKCSGAFLAGVIVPRDGGLAIALTEKLEDMVSVMFLPLVSFSAFEVDA